MMTFPGLPQKSLQEFENQRQAILNSVPAAVAQELEMVDRGSELSAEAQALKDQLKAFDYSKSEAGLRHSIAGRMGTALETISRWAGFDWRTNIALIGGFAAKEVVVSTLGTAYSLGQVDPEESGSLSDTLAKDPNWTPLMAVGLIVFTIFYSPCFVAVICIVRESGTWRWGAFAMIFNTVLAFALAVLILQVGTALGILVK
jgi:ferrous iron transport protein B